jgi:hypothetical protein
VMSTAQYWNNFFSAYHFSYPSCGRRLILFRRVKMAGIKLPFLVKSPNFWPCQYHLYPPHNKHMIWE